jgi:hypothetical protein
MSLELKRQLRIEKTSFELKRVAENLKDNWLQMEEAMDRNMWGHWVVSTSVSSPFCIWRPKKDSLKKGIFFLQISRFEGSLEGRVSSPGVCAFFLGKEFKS